MLLPNLRDHELELWGWKLGYTSVVMRQQMHVSEPNLAPLTSNVLVTDGGFPTLTLAQPRVEPEIALQLIADLPADCSLEQVAGAVGSVVCA